MAESFDPKPNQKTTETETMKNRIFALALFVSLALSLSVQAAAISVTAGNVKPSIYAVFLPGDHYAAVAVTAGQAVYVDSSVATPGSTTPDVRLASATGSGDAVKPVGIATNGAGVGQPIKVCIRDPQFTLGGAVTAGAIVVLHSTAGAVTLTAADITGSGTWYVTVFGVGINTTQINLGGTSYTALGYLGVIRADVALP